MYGCSEDFSPQGAVWTDSGCGDRRIYIASGGTGHWGATVTHCCCRKHHPCSLWAKADMKQRIFLMADGYVYHLQVRLFVFFKQDYTNSTGQFSWKLYQRWIFQSSRALELWVNQPQCLYKNSEIMMRSEIHFRTAATVYTDQNSRHL